MGKYSRFGLAFERSFLVRQGAAPVIYLPLNSARSSMLLRGEWERAADQVAEVDRRHFPSWQRHAAEHDAEMETMDPDKLSFWNLTRFLEDKVFPFLKCFDDSLPQDSPENYYMEREWRVHGSVRFQPSDVSRVILPAQFEPEFRVRLGDAIPVTAVEDLVAAGSLDTS